MNSTSAVLHAHRMEVSLQNGLLGLLPQLSPSGVWIREGEGMIGLGHAASSTAAGRNRFSDLAAFWDSLETHEEAVAFVSVTFGPNSEYLSHLIVPEVLIRCTAGQTTVLITTSQEATPAQTLQRHGLRVDDQGQLTHRSPREVDLPPTALWEGGHSERQYLNAVVAGLSVIRSGTAEKLVLARDVVVSASEPLPTGLLLARLAEEYPQTWTYCVSAAGDSAQTLLGATPEMLVRLRGRQLSSRVLAGTIARAERTSALVEDAKQHREHQLAVTSLVEQLDPVAEALQAPAEPSVLQLPNLYHLASDITGTVSADSSGNLPSPLQVAEAAHPTAAVCGTPTTTAASLIAQLEGMDRGPYAGPVGWIDTRGNADFGIALRGGVLENRLTLRLFAGCGVVEGSAPESELSETRVKLTPMLWALGLEHRQFPAPTGGA